MNEREAFLAAIRAAPDDAAPALIFADWLEERGDESTADFYRRHAGKSYSPKGTMRIGYRWQTVVNCWIVGIGLIIVEADDGARYEFEQGRQWNGEDWELTFSTLNS